MGSMNQSVRPVRRRKEAEELRRILLPPEERVVPQNSEQFSREEVERMREIVLRSDRGSINVFDLNNPPKVPYKHQEFPKMVYDHSKAEPSREVVKKTREGEEMVHIAAKLGQKIVNNEAELAEALASGYVEEPPVFGAPDEGGDIDPEAHQEAPHQEAAPRGRRKVH
jgi:hypothetical protein